MFPGFCVRCGRLQVWTYHAGAIWVACPVDCPEDQLALPGFSPLVALYPEEVEVPLLEGTLGEVEGKTL